ncbi:MAG: hypothetical protein ABEL04_03705 [Salinibacter sp.]|uniref:hypothetical protein n=1 Tax=Salinibacter sp. TaxID=2065818 RepID=UPI0035D41F1E
MRCRFSFFVLASLVGFLVGAVFPGSTAAQQPADSIRAKALRDFHGSDMEGKDGPLAKAGLDLLTLYHQYKAFQKRGGDTFEPNSPGLRVSNGRVTIDAIAAASTEQLRVALERLGLKDAATAGQLVSGRFPIAQIPALANVESLRGVMPSRMKTQDEQLRPTPQTIPPDSVSQDRRESGESKSSSKNGEGTGSESGTGGGVLLLLAGLIAALALAEA